MQGRALELPNHFRFVHSTPVIDLSSEEVDRKGIVGSLSISATTLQPYGQVLIRSFKGLGRG